MQFLFRMDRISRPRIFKGRRNNVEVAVLRESSYFKIQRREMFLSRVILAFDNFIKRL